jgi:hypothetical protein
MGKQQMDFIITEQELDALCGLPHIQQLVYLRAIRPYMDVKSKITGIKRRISYQSISEQLYIEPQPGIKSQRFSRDQIRRAVAGLERVGVIESRSEGKQLILKCLLATKHFANQNKAAINSPQDATIKQPENNLINTGLNDFDISKANIVDHGKAAIPQEENNYIYLSHQFERFWKIYPEKKSRDQAFEVFKQYNPDDSLVNQIIQALETQISVRANKITQGQWVPPWKYPANWLSQKCWQDEITTNLKKEIGNESRTASGKRYQSTIDEVNANIEQFNKRVSVQKSKTFVIDDAFFEIGDL